MTNITELLNLLQCLESSSAKSPAAAAPASAFGATFVGQAVIARCTGAGVHAGTLVSMQGDSVVLADSRRLWRWHAKGGIALSGLAMHGLDYAKDNKIDTMVPTILLQGVCELIPLSTTAEDSIKRA